jgi:hypothetical protein
MITMREVKNRKLILRLLNEPIEDCGGTPTKIRRNLITREI